MTQDVWDMPKYSTHADVKVDLSDVTVDGKKMQVFLVSDVELG